MTGTQGARGSSRPGRGDLTPHIALIASFGVEDVVLIHMLDRLAADVPTFTIHSGRLSQRNAVMLESELSD
jgi:hypothetical protein